MNKYWHLCFILSVSRKDEIFRRTAFFLEHKTSITVKLCTVEHLSLFICTIFTVVESHQKGFVILE